MPEAIVFMFLGLVGSVFKLKHNFWLSTIFFLVPSYFEYSFFKSYGISLVILSTASSFVLFLEYISWKQKLTRKEVWSESWDYFIAIMFFVVGFSVVKTFFWF